MFVESLFLATVNKFIGTHSCFNWCFQWICLTSCNVFVDMSMQQLANIGNLYQGLQGKLYLLALHAARVVKCGSFNTLTPLIDKSCTKNDGIFCTNVAFIKIFKSLNVHIVFPGVLASLIYIRFLFLRFCNSSCNCNDVHWVEPYLNGGDSGSCQYTENNNTQNYRNEQVFRTFLYRFVISWSKLKWNSPVAKYWGCTSDQCG